MEHRTVTIYKAALLVGAMVGGTLSLLYAPHTGGETRRLLRSKTEAVRQLVQAPGHSSGEPDDDDAHARKLAALHMERVKGVQMDNKMVTMGFLTGAIIGGVVGLLYAPKSGKETREFLKTKAEHTKQEAYILAEHAKEVAIEKARKAKAAAAAAHEEVEAEQNS
jgi:gas vesicle protein